ncbi:MAG TPA: aspartate-semialdehyde dehydrogenase [Myxococcota bacterium]|nr:aspartate-semialdehyde dehydrogenase [Myxococcota bacterium]HPV03383.1 aspartate-semialdehyde dehydrogenase [Myxococcota bacterium]
MSDGMSVAVVGATGVVGTEAVALLEERGFPVGSLRLMASGRSAGETIGFRGKDVTIEALAGADFAGIDLIFSAPGASVSLEYVPRAVAAGALVIDKSSAFRMAPDVPLVVPEVNGDAASRETRIIASPNCSTIPLVMVLDPLHRRFGIRRVVVSTYQAVSGAGQKAGDELIGQTVAILNRRPMPIEVFPHQIAFNCLPQVETFEPGLEGYSTEEQKVCDETRKIMGIPDLRITATCVRVPVVNGHSESVNIEFESPVDPAEARKLLDSMPGIRIVDSPAQGEYPMAVEASGLDEVLVGRIRRDFSVDNGLNLWLACDNIRKGAALNAIQIAERVFGIDPVRS